MITATAYIYELFWNHRPCSSRKDKRFPSGMSDTVNRNGNQFMTKDVLNSTELLPIARKEVTGGDIPFLGLHLGFIFFSNKCPYTLLPVAFAAVTLALVLSSLLVRRCRVPG